MSLYGTMRTGVSGMNAQANRLGTVGDNIANSSTVGYKKATAEFSSMVLPSGSGEYNSGGVNTNVRYSIDNQGSFSYTTSATDLAIDGRGFFVVEASDGSNYLTRAGNFSAMPDGTLQNAAGFTLMGYEYSSISDPTIVINGYDGLTPVNLQGGTTQASPSKTGVLNANLPANEPIGFTKTTSLVAYDSQGNARLIDYVYEKTAANTWMVDARYQGTSILAPSFTPTSTIDVSGNLDSSAAAGTTVTAPYSLIDTDGVARDFDVTYTRNATGWSVDFAYEGTVFMSDSIEDTEFDGSGNYIDPLPEIIPPVDAGTWKTGPINVSFSKLTSVASPLLITANANGAPLTAGSPVELKFDSNGKLSGLDNLKTELMVIEGAELSTLTIDISGTTQLSSDFSVENGNIDGSAATPVVAYEVSDDGVVFLKYSDGKLQPRYRIAMADVASPNLLTSLAGNVYSQSRDSGVVVMGYAGSSGYGKIMSNTLENSNVDIASELTSMIEAQRNYTANSKVFQAGSELLEVLVNLKR